MKSTSGRRKVLFGSNHPMLVTSQALEDVDALGLDDETRAQFLAGNAERLLATTARSTGRSGLDPGVAT